MIFVGEEKMTSDMGGMVRYWAHRQMAKEHFHNHRLMYATTFEEVAWWQVYSTLRGLPRLFSLWAGKQMMNIAATNDNLAKRDRTKKHCKLCPSCESSVETCLHVLTCPEEGRVELLMETIKNVELWLRSAETDPILVSCICEYARGRGGRSMLEVCRSQHIRYRKL